MNGIERRHDDVFTVLRQLGLWWTGGNGGLAQKWVVHAMPWQIGLGFSSAHGRRTSCGRSADPASSVIIAPMIHLAYASIENLALNRRDKLRTCRIPLVRDGADDPRYAAGQRIADKLVTAVLDKDVGNLLARRQPRSRRT